MRENYRNSIASINKFPQFTTMNVIDGQAGLVIYASLIFYSLTVDNILNIIVLLILAGISIQMLTGDNGILQKATDAKTETEKGQEKEIVALAYNSALTKKVSNGDSTAVTSKDLNSELTNQRASANGSNPITVTFDISGRQYTINNDGSITYIGLKSENQISNEDFEKIYAYFYGKKTDDFSSVDHSSFPPRAVYQNNETLGINGINIIDIGNIDNDTGTGSYNYIHYNGKIYRFELDWDTEKVTNVEFINVDSSTPGEYRNGNQRLFVTSDGQFIVKYQSLNFTDFDGNNEDMYCISNSEGYLFYDSLGNNINISSKYGVYTGEDYSFHAQYRSFIVTKDGKQHFKYSTNNTFNYLDEQNNTQTETNGYISNDDDGITRYYTENGTLVQIYDDR